MANAPTITAEPGLLDLTGTPTSPWWRDGGLRKLVFWQTCILAAQITVGYDEVIIGSFQALQPWQDGKLRLTHSCYQPVLKQPYSHGESTY